MTEKYNNIKQINQPYYLTALGFDDFYMRKEYGFTSDGKKKENG